MATVVSVNIGTPREVGWVRSRRTSIDKRPVDGSVRVHALGIDGDQVSNRKHRGGLDKAVYAYAREDLDGWAIELGRAIRDGQFGENLTTRGIDVNAAEIGERWRIGGVELEVAGVRTPCQVFRGWMGVSGFDNRGWIKRFAEVGRPGPYLRVLAEGELAAGDELVVVHRPGHGRTVATTFREVMAGRNL